MGNLLHYADKEELLQAFKNYYFNTFGEDLKKWFDIEESFGDIKVPFIGFASNNHQPADFKIRTENEFFFSVSCFYTFLIPQAVALIANDKKAFFNFSKCSGWPVCSCGLGGFMSAPQIVMEAHLEPAVEDKTTHNHIMETVLDFFLNEVRVFLTGDAQNLNPTAYSALCDITKGKIDEVCNVIVDAVNKYMAGKKDSYMLSATSDFWN